MDDHSSAAPVTLAVKLPTRTFGLKRPCGGLLPTGKDLSTQGPYSALLRVGLAIPSRLPGPWWALTPPFHHHHGPVQGKPRTPWQSLLCGAFPEVALAGHYPAPLLHGVRTFLEGPHLSAEPPAITQPSAQGRSKPKLAAVQAFSAVIAAATASASARSSGASGPRAHGLNRNRNAANRCSGVTAG